LSDLPIACTLSPDQLNERREGPIRDVAARAVEITECGEGYALRFPADDATFAAVVALVDGERRCCAFLRFDLAVEPGGRGLALAITGPSGTKAFLAEALGLSLRAGD
jgi:hypothetical protein